MTVPATKRRNNVKKLNLSPGEELYLARMERKTSIPGLILKEIALKERIPVTSLKILGGNPFIDVSGLDRKIQNKAEDEHLTVKEIGAKLIQAAEEENGYTSRAHGIVKYLDKIGFKESLGKLDPSTISREILEKLEEIYTETYSDEGWANAEDCAAIAWTYKKVGDYTKKRDKLLTTNINMMACRRASSRAKRQATGCGLTSLDEAPMVNNQSADAIEEQRKATKEQLERIKELKTDKLLTRTEVKLIEKELKNNPSEVRAEQIIKRIEDLVVGRIPAKDKVKKQNQGGLDHEESKKGTKEKVLI
ncbi:hypothetical protein ES703_42405 [subsurface metagenome]